MSGCASSLACLRWAGKWHGPIAWSASTVVLYYSALSTLVRPRIRRSGWRLSWRWLIVLILPIALDTLTHTVSDVQGMGLGFRETNAWLAVLTGHILPASFYAGDAIGSFNSLMRLVTGWWPALLSSFGPFLEWTRPCISAELTPVSSLGITRRHRS